MDVKKLGYEYFSHDVEHGFVDEKESVKTYITGFSVGINVACSVMSSNVLSLMEDKLSEEDLEKLRKAFKDVKAVEFNSGGLKQFRKKPVVIEAWQTSEPMEIPTLEGIMHADAGDWIITGVNGEHYPCKPDIFNKTYEPLEA